MIHIAYGPTNLITNIPEKLKNRIKKQLTFNNPAFLSASRYSPHEMRFSRIPPEIEDYEVVPEGLIVPRGFRLSHVPAIVTEDYRISVPAEWPSGKVSLLPRQVEARDKFLSECRVGRTEGCLVLPPGGGKTLLGLSIAAALKQKTLVIVHRQSYLKVWLDDARRGYGLTDVGMVRGNKFEIKSPLTIAMVQTLWSRDTAKLETQFGMVIEDECHHLPSRTFTETVRKFYAKYLMGITATPERADGMHPRLYWSLGPIIYSTDDIGDLTMPVKIIPVPTPFTFANSGEVFDFHACLNAMVECMPRNELIVQKVREEYETGHSCLILSRRVRHAEGLAEMLSNAGIDVETLVGTSGPSTIQESLRRVDRGECRCIVGTYSFLQEGVSCRRWDRLFLATGLKWKGDVIQSIGRIRRVHPEKKDAIVYDFYDPAVSVLFRHFKLRKNTYEDLKGVVVT